MGKQKTVNLATKVNRTKIGGKFINFTKIGEKSINSVEIVGYAIRSIGLGGMDANAHKSQQLADLTS